MSLGNELLAVPFPEMVQKLGIGIASAQLQLDLVSMRIARLMAGYDEEDTDAGEGDNPPNPYLIEFGDGKKYSLLELGFTPTFYQFVDTVIEVKMSISMSTQREVKRSANASVSSAGFVVAPFGAGGAVQTASVSASYAAKYQYSAEGSSMLRTKLVPVPPPAILEDRIRELIKPRPES
jgi:hypothetical protein